MNKPLLDKLMDAKKENDIAHVSFFNDGSIKKDENYSAQRINKINNREQFEAIEEVFYNATRSYSRNFDFDSIEVELLLGLIFDVKDIDENDNIKENAKPIEGIVRYYTGSTTSYLENNKTNTIDYSVYGVGRQGYIEFDKLIAYIKDSGLVYQGPETFNEFEEGILLGENFNIALTANLQQKEEKHKVFRKR